MQCPYCSHAEQKVLDSRPAREGEAIRRRRECMLCGRRFTTFEEFERPRLFVVKRDGSRAEFSREKVLAGMLVACHKRPVPIDVLKEAAALIERDLVQEFEDEVPTTEIGERVVEALRKIDTVAFVRFASVYREFQTVSDFREIVESCREEPVLR